MTALAYYNEHDPKTAAWLRELIKAGHIAPGVVDERSIEDIHPDELRGFTQCHFFAGIGVWSYALRRAGWPDDKPVWTGSCPCQPFSAAGKGAGFADERHLWPAWFHLITTAKPESVPVFGEQVASKDGLAWLDLVQADMETAGYAFGAVDLCAAGVGAPHIRQRAFFVGNPLGAGLEGHPRHEDNTTGRSQPIGPTAETGGDGGLADPALEQLNRPRSCRAGGGFEHSDGGEFGGLANSETGGRLEECENAGGRGSGGSSEERAAGCDIGGTVGGLADANSEPTGRNSRGAHGQKAGDGAENCDDNRPTDDGGDGRPRPTNGLWADADWLYCRDGKWRPVEPGTFPLAHGAPARVGRLCGYGNAINAEVAVAFIEAVREATCY